MDEYVKDWLKYKLTIATDKGDISIKWNNVNELAKWANIQSGLYLQNSSSSLQLFFDYFPRWNQYFWNQRFDKGMFNLPDDARIVDIGCGVSVIDMILASYIPRSKFWLVDKEGFTFRPGIYYDLNYPKYHSWSPVSDAIEASNLDETRFKMIGENDQFPENVDCVTSWLSWGWHYPKEVYWEKAFNSLKIGGKLIMDIRSLDHRDTMGEITEAMKSNPTIINIDRQIPKHVDAMLPPAGSTVSGYRAMWEKCL